MCITITINIGIVVDDTLAAIAALEAVGNVLQNASELLRVACDQLCLAFIKVAGSHDGVLVTTALRGVEILIYYAKPYLRFQIEAIFNTIFRPGIMCCSFIFLHVMSVAENGAKHPAAFATLECLSRFCANSSIMADVYSCYDCDKRFSDVFDNLCRSLAKVCTCLLQ